MTWSPTSWKTKPATQQVAYGDAAALARVVDEMGRLPPLVTSCCLLYTSDAADE